MKKINDVKELFSLFDSLDLYKIYGIKKLGVFGSFARGEAFRDIDIYIDEDLNYVQIQDLKDKLEKQTGISFDILVKKNAEPVILHRAFKDMQYATAY